MIRRIHVFVVCSAALVFAGCGKDTPSSSTPPQRLIFFLGDGMGINVMTAARIYSVGEDGDLTMDTLPENGFVRTYSQDAQVTDSAAAMTAYMSGIKVDNDVIGVEPSVHYQQPVKPVPTLGEIAKQNGYAVGVVTTTRITHATPAGVYAHTSDRDAEEGIAAQLVPGGNGYNTALGTGLEVIFGGGTTQFAKSSRTDGRDLFTEMQNHGYNVVFDNRQAFDNLKQGKSLALFTKSHMSYELDRDASKEPSLSDMTTKAMALLGQTQKNYFLMVEGGRIDHALHSSNAKRALGDAVAFDNAIAAAIAEAKKTDPELKNTTIVVTADHDHTLVLNGYAKRTGKTTDTNAGVLGLVHNYTTGELDLDAEGRPYTIIGFGNGENRPSGARSALPPLTEAATAALEYRQEAAVRMSAGNETHGGTDVAIMAIGHDAESFHGFMTNTEVFGKLLDAAHLPKPSSN